MNIKRRVNMIIKPTAEDCVRVTIGNWEVWIDDSTGEKIISQYFLDDKEAKERK
jgi:t-SNARE complex subunit (syntaxin)